MYAIIDIETCGGKFEFRKGRIIDICIIIHDGTKVIDKFSTLINPECYISPYFTNISGITNEMVADAPTFELIAKKIIEITEGKIFIAHNVGFDYGFIKEELENIGYKYRRETLCTVKLSKKLIPNRISYSLGHLCASLGIEIEGRHRAEGDAVATVELFDLLLQLKNQNPLYNTVEVEEITAKKIDKSKEHILKNLPEECGVFYLLNTEGEIIYIGKSKNVYNKAMSYLNSVKKKGKKMLDELHAVDFVATGSELIASLMEVKEIKKHKPKYNRIKKVIEEEIKDHIRFTESNFILIDKGRNEYERAIVKIENNQFTGYGYFETFDQITSPEELKGYANRGFEDLDSNEIIKIWMEKQTRLNKVLF